MPPTTDTPRAAEGPYRVEGSLCVSDKGTPIHIPLHAHDHAWQLNQAFQNGRAAADAELVEAITDVEAAIRIYQEIGRKSDRDRLAREADNIGRLLARHKGTA